MLATLIPPKTATYFQDPLGICVSKYLWTKVSMLEATEGKNVEVGHQGTTKANDSNRHTMISHQALDLMENDAYYV